MQIIHSARLTLCTLLVLTVAACGGSDSDSTSADNSTEQQSFADSSEQNTNVSETEALGELPSIFQPPPAPGSTTTTFSFDGLWDASDVDKSETRYWLISSNDGAWTTYLLDPNTNNENCFVVTSTRFTEEGLDSLTFTEYQPQTITALNGVIGISVSSDVLNLSYQDSSSAAVNSSHSAVTAITVQDLQLCN